jgi:hypothetical protein
MGTGGDQAKQFSFPDWLSGVAENRLSSSLIGRTVPTLCSDALCNLPERSDSEHPESRMEPSNNQGTPLIGIIWRGFALRWKRSTSGKHGTDEMGSPGI